MAVRKLGASPTIKPSAEHSPGAAPWPVVRSAEWSLQLSHGYSSITDASRSRRLWRFQNISTNFQPISVSYDCTRLYLYWDAVAPKTVARELPELIFIGKIRTNGRTRFVKSQRIGWRYPWISVDREWIYKKVLTFINIGIGTRI